MLKAKPKHKRAAIWHRQIAQETGTAGLNPMERDKSLYLEEDGERIKQEVQNAYRISNDSDRGYFKRTAKALDIWEGLEKATAKCGIEGLNGGNHLEKNSFWFAHPVYFVKHLNDAGLLVDQKRIEDLKMVQNNVLALKCLEKGARGMYNNEPTSRDQTYCNHAVFLTVIATDGNFSNFTGENKLNWDSGEQKFPEARTKEEISKYQTANINTSNFWCDKLEELADAGKIARLSPREAQYYGNMGYTVVASYKANLNVGLKEWSPHFATVRPEAEYDETEGPMVLNIGGHNLIERAGDRRCFDMNRYAVTKWYYNPDQEFRTDIRWINTLKEKYGTTT